MSNVHVYSSILAMQTSMRVCIYCMITIKVRMYTDTAVCLVISHAQPPSSAVVQIVLKLKMMFTSPKARPNATPSVLGRVLCVRAILCNSPKGKNSF